MGIVSLSFILFFSGAVILYFIVPKRVQWMALLLVNLLFYAQAGLKYLPYLLITSLSIYLISLAVNRNNVRYREESKELSRAGKKELRAAYDKRKKRFVFLAVLINFGILFFYKYTDYYLARLAERFPDSGIHPFGLILPLGISFYTFQAIGYLIDVYRGTTRVEHNFFKLLLFLSYFPQMIQGPIGRFGDLAPQLYQERKFDCKEFHFGLQLVLWGYFKKLVIADGLARIVNPILADVGTYQGFYVPTAVFLYSLQIYCDFSGGIDAVSGFSQMMGIRLATNFERPFFATSLSNFWQRWHMTLGSWMRDYVFYPIALSPKFTGINRFFKKKNKPKLAKLLPSSIASMIVFILVGLWHGPNFKYLVFGLYNAVIITSSLLLEDRFKIWLATLKIKTEAFSWKVFQIIRTVIICTIGRYFSRAADFGHAVDMFKASTENYNPWIFFDDSFFQFGVSNKQFFVIFIALLILFVVSIIQEKGIKVREKIAEQNLYLRIALQLGLVFAILIFGFYGSNVDTTDFIYQGF